MPKPKMKKLYDGKGAIQQIHVNPDSGLKRAIAAAASFAKASAHHVRIARRSGGGNGAISGTKANGSQNINSGIYNPATGAMLTSHDSGNEV